MFQKVDHVLPKGDQPIFSPSIPHNQKLTVICRLFFRKTYNFTSFVAILTIDARLKILRLWQLILVSRSRLRASGGQLPLRVLVSQIDWYSVQNWVGSPIFFNFVRKNNCSHAQILSRKCPFSKKHPTLMPIFFKKTSIPSKTRGNSYSFCFSIFNEKPPSVMPIFGKKTSILSKLSQ